MHATVVAKTEANCRRAAMRQRAVTGRQHGETQSGYREIKADLDALDDCRDAVAGCRTCAWCCSGEKLHRFFRDPENFPDFPVCFSLLAPVQAFDLLAGQSHGPDFAPVGNVRAVNKILDDRGHAPAHSFNQLTGQESICVPYAARTGETLKALSPDLRTAINLEAVQPLIFVYWKFARSCIRKMGQSTGFKDLFCDSHEFRRTPALERQPGDVSNRTRGGFTRGHRPADPGPLELARNAKAYLLIKLPWATSPTLTVSGLCDLCFCP